MSSRIRQPVANSEIDMIKLVAYILRAYASYCKSSNCKR